MVTRALENLITSLVFGLNFLEGVGRVVEHAQLTIAVRGDYLLLPTGFQRMGDSSEKEKKRLFGKTRDQQERARL